MRRNAHFGVSILGADQETLGRFFARADRPSGSGAFDQVPHCTGIGGVPSIEGAAAQLECRARRSIRVGDHLMYVGEVVGLHVDGAVDSLAFHRAGSCPSPDRAPRPAERCTLVDAFLPAGTPTRESG